MSRRSSGSSRFHGFLVIDKPAGWTSHDVVARVRRLLGERQVGHGGTLDPAATGVLPVAVGCATKVVEFLAASSKTYLAEITFGVETDSHDVDGQVTGIGNPSSIDELTIETALSMFRGEIDQVPPMHSAIKIGGRPLYERARRGEEIVRPSRRIAIHDLTLLEWRLPIATVMIDCSKGTYVRALARDLGSEVGTGAYLSNLVRLRTGPFDLCQAWTLRELEEHDLEAEWPSIAVHPDRAAQTLQTLIIDAEGRRKWTTGQSIPGTVIRPGQANVYDDKGEWLGIAGSTATSGEWKPIKVTTSAA